MFAVDIAQLHSASFGMKKLCLAVEALGVKYGGGATVLLDLLDAAIPDERFERVHVLCSPAASRRFNLPRSPKIIEVECPFAEGNKLYRLWWIERRLSVYLRENGCDVLLCLSGCGNGGTAARHVTVVQQSLPFSPEVGALMGMGERLRLRVLRSAMRRSCMASSRIIVQTYAMQEAVSAAFSISRDRIKVCMPGVRQSGFRPVPTNAVACMRRVTPGRRLLYVGNQSRYKNVQCIRSAVGMLRRRIPEIRAFLTLPPDHAAAAEDAICCLGYLNKTELAEAYSLADLLIMPSRQETVALPLLEAMSVGLPVVAANRPYAREVCGDAAMFFDPDDPSDLAAAVERLLVDAHLRAHCTKEGLRLNESRCAARPYQQMLDEAAHMTDLL